MTCSPGARSSLTRAWPSRFRRSTSPAHDQARSPSISAGLSGWRAAWAARMSISAADTQIRRRDLLVGPERVRGALEHDGAVVDDVDAVREPERHLGILLDQQHADALALELADCA